MAETSAAKKAVDLEGLKVLGEIFPTKEEVKKQIGDAQLSGGSVEYASADEIRALFADNTPESGNAESGE